MCDVFMNTDFKHGRNGYIVHRCRCDICSHAESEYGKKNRADGKSSMRWTEPGFKHGTNGYQIGCHCDVCKMAYSQYKKQHRLENLERIREAERNNLKKHAVEHRARVKRYIKENPEWFREKNNRWKANNPEKVRNERQRYYRNNVVLIKQKHNQYQNMMYKTSPMYRLRRNLRSRVGRAVEGGTKSAHTLELLGCTVPELQGKIYLLFQPGMTWDNYGQWHLDHIIPCAAFDLSNPVHQRACFNWQNLQPLWGKDNQRKNDRIPVGIDVDSFVGQFEREA